MTDPGDSPWSSRPARYLKEKITTKTKTSLASKYSRKQSQRKIKKANKTKTGVVINKLLQQRTNNATSQYIHLR